MEDDGRRLRVVGYTRVSTEEQERTGYGLDAQETAIRAEVERQGWELVALEVDAGVSAAARKRPALDRALEAVRSGAADGLVVAKLDRLARSTLAFATLLADAKRQGWRLVLLDLGVDTATPAGSMVASVVAAIAEYERDLIRQRTRDALAAARPRLAAQGRQLGRRSTVPAELVERIAAEHAAGASLRAIAARLNAEGVPTGQPRRPGQPPTRWHAPSVGRMLERARQGAAT